MWESGARLEAEFRQAEKDKAEGRGPRIGLSPEALKRRLAKKKEAARKAKGASDGRRS